MMSRRKRALAERNRLIEKIVSQYEAGADGTMMPIVSLEDFFEGNWDERSLAPNKVGYDRPPLAECYRILRGLRNHPAVQDVLVAIHETPVANDPEDFDIWPDSDTVYVLASCEKEVIAKESEALKIDDIGIGWSCNTGIQPPGAPQMNEGVKVFALWWD
jgi:hypothetical protein